MTQKIIVGLVGLALALGGMPSGARSAAESASALNPWPNLIEQAETLGLPTRFLKEIDPEFVTVVFEDLRTYAAEYHPKDHRMILNLRLSFNNAGGALTALDRMTHHDLNLLYHELFHAYLDYIFHGPGPQGLSPQANRVLAFANEQLRCHYRFVYINPIRQRHDAREMRFLSNNDAWEVLNETWAVFVGWQIWTKLELHQGVKGVGTWTDPMKEDWAQRLKTANKNGELLGYYEPDDPEERRVARKRFIAPSHGITPEGAKLLLEVIMEEPGEIVDEGGLAIKETQDHFGEKLPCE